MLEFVHKQNSDIHSNYNISNLINQKSKNGIYNAKQTLIGLNIFMSNLISNCYANIYYTSYMNCISNLFYFNNKSDQYRFSCLSDISIISYAFNWMYTTHCTLQNMCPTCPINNYCNFIHENIFSCCECTKTYWTFMYFILCMVD